MSAQLKPFKLGQEVYFATKEGEIVRSFVSEVSVSGWFNIGHRTGLFGSDPLPECFDTFEHAVPSARQALKLKRQELENLLSEVKKQEENLGDAAYKAAIRDRPVALLRREDLTKVDILPSIPDMDEHPALGSLVYGILSPQTKWGFPFVDEWKDSRVRSFTVCWLGLTRDGTVVYRTDDWEPCGRMCKDAHGFFRVKEEAEAALAELKQRHQAATADS